MASPAAARSVRRAFLSSSCVFLAAILALSLVSILAAALGILRSCTLRRNASADGHSGLLLTRFELIHRQAVDHAALVKAYGAYAIRSKVEVSRGLRNLEKFVASFSSVSARLAVADAIEGDAVLSIEKELVNGEKSYRKLVLEWKERFEALIKIQKLYDTIFAMNLQLQQARKFEKFSVSIAARSTPKSLHCLNLRLMQEPYAIRDLVLEESTDLDLYHYAIISDNVIAASVAVNSAAESATEPSKHFFHLITDQIHLVAFQIWFSRRPPPGGAKIDIRSDFDLPFLKSPTSPPLERLKFYLPEIYPRLKRIILLEDDVVVQKDMAEIWSTDLNGNANGGVEICFGPFRRFSQFLNFSHPAVMEKFSPSACAWGHGVNLFDLDAWRKQNLTERFEFYENMNSDGSLWGAGSWTAAELMTFEESTRPLEREWNVMGLGRNPKIPPEEIADAGAVHFDGAMKPWLDVAMNQYKPLWTRYLPADDKLLQLCNFGL